MRDAHELEPQSRAIHPPPRVGAEHPENVVEPAALVLQPFAAFWHLDGQVVRWARDQHLPTRSEAGFVRLGTYVDEILRRQAGQEVRDVVLAHVNGVAIVVASGDEQVAPSAEAQVGPGLLRQVLQPTFLVAEQGEFSGRLLTEGAVHLPDRRHLLDESADDGLHPFEANSLLHLRFLAHSVADYFCHVRVSYSYERSQMKAGSRGRPSGARDLWRMVTTAPSAGGFLLALTVKPVPTGASAPSATPPTSAPITPAQPSLPSRSTSPSGGVFRFTTPEHS